MAVSKITTCYSDRQYSGEERGYGRESSYRKKSQNRDFLVALLTGYSKNGSTRSMLSARKQYEDDFLMPMISKIIFDL